MINKNNIHPTAIIDPGAQIGSNVTIEAYAVIRGNVTLEDGVTVKSHAYIDGYTTIGEGTIIYPSASIGTKTQDRKYNGERTFVVIGKNCEIREFVTINSSSQEGSTVRIGDDCLIMAYCHVAHHCELGKGVIMSNNAMLAGHIVIEDYAIIGGATPIHQFCRIGKYAMVGGLSRITHDVPPYTLVAGIPPKLGGLNLVGLKRNGFPFEVRRDLSKAFKWVYRSGLHLEEAIEKIENELPESEHIAHWLDFCRTTKRGLIGLGATHEPQEELLEEYEELAHENV